MRNLLISIGTIAAFWLTQLSLSVIFSTVPAGWIASILLCGGLLGVGAMFVRFHWDDPPSR